MSWEDDNSHLIALHESWLDAQNEKRLKEEKKRAFRTDLWRTQDGKVIPIKDMGDKHLFNAYRHTQNSLLF
jgi:hypothetical protein